MRPRRFPIGVGRIDPGKLQGGLANVDLRIWESPDGIESRPLDPTSANLGLFGGFLGQVDFLALGYEFLALGLQADHPFRLDPQILRDLHRTEFRTAH